MLVRFTVIFAVFALVFAAGWLFTRGSYPVSATVADDPALPHFTIAGYRFHGETFGSPDAPTIIVVHGGPGWDYKGLLPLRALSDEYFVVFYDQRGSGLSPRVTSAELSIDSALADLDAIVDHFRNEKTVRLIGHSWGAMLVTAYLGREPHKVSHTVLAEPGFLNRETFEQSGIRLGPRWEVGYLWFAAKRWFQSLHVDRRDSHAAMDYFLSEVAARANPAYYCQGAIPDVALEHWRAGAVAMRATFAASRGADGKPDLDLTSGLYRFQRPVLLLASECNRLIGFEQQHRHARYFARTTLEVIPDSGHMMFAENPAASLAAIRDYLSRR